MKKINILLIAAFCIIATSCDKFLDIKPVGKVIPTSQQDFRDVLTDAYSKVPTDRNISMLRADELSLKKDNDSGEHTRYVNQYTWQDELHSNGDITMPWEAFYRVILCTNQVIIDGAEATDRDKNTYNQLMGEAYVLRAYMHFGLVNLFADVYSKDKESLLAIPLATSIDLFKDYRRNTIGEVYSNIRHDIDEGLSLLSIDEQAKGQNYRFSKLSTYAFAARVALYMSDWDNVISYSSKAMAINSSLEDFNDAASKLAVAFDSKENILALEQTFGSDYSYRFYISSELENAYDKSNDLRFTKYFKGDKAGEYKCILGKDLKNKVSIRTAELYLMMAEAQAKSKNADLSLAKKSLKDLLVKRFTPDYFAAQAALIDAMSSEDFVKRVELERFRELACQGFRWYDLRRNGKPALNKSFDGKDYSLRLNDARYVVPFPLDALINNPNLKEN